MVIQAPDHGGGLRRMLAAEGVGIGLQLLVAGEARPDVVLVRGALLESGDEEFPYSAVAAAHGMTADIPIVEFAGDGDILGVRRPDSEAHAGDAFGGDEVGAERAPGLVESALGMQVKIG